MVQRGSGVFSTAAKTVAKTAGIGALSALLNKSLHSKPAKKKKRRRKTVIKTARRGQAGGAFPLLVPATGGLSGAAGFGVQKLLKKLSSKRNKKKRRS